MTKKECQQNYEAGMYTAGGFRMFTGTTTGVVVLHITDDRQHALGYKFHGGDKKFFKVILRTTKWGQRFIRLDNMDYTLLDFKYTKEV